MHPPLMDIALTLPKELIVRPAQTSPDVAMIWMDQPLDQVQPTRITGPFGTELVPVLNSPVCNART